MIFLLCRVASAFHFYEDDYGELRDGSDYHDQGDYGGGGDEQYDIDHRHRHRYNSGNRGQRHRRPGGAHRVSGREIGSHHDSRVIDGKGNKIYASLSKSYELTLIILIT